MTNAANVAQKVGGTAVMQEVPSKPASVLGI